MSKATKTTAPSESALGVLAKLEGAGAALAKQQTDDHGFAEQKRQLRAEYERTVRPLLPELAALEREARPKLNRADALPFERFGQAGVSQHYILAVERTTGELEQRFGNVARLKMIPADIENLGPRFDTTGVILGTADLKLEMRAAGGLAMSIKRHLEMLDSQLAELLGAYERRPKKVTELPLRPPRQGHDSGSPTQQDTGDSPAA